ncbi:hypothetical protein HanRHA438_Chr16g0769981 [Helianthus annuus]|nr:hypothetical protein HanRHA438_Chr16g0769981 [Helianthus annuus]
MKFYQSSSSEAQLSKFKPARNCLPCFQSHSTNHHMIKDMTEPLYVKTNPGVVAKLMGLDSIPQRRIPLVHHQEDTRGHPNGKTSMVLEIKKGKFYVLGFEAGCKGKGETRIDSKRKLAEDDESKKKKRVTETLKSNKVLKESANVDFELGFLDQLVLELLYVI